MKIIAKDFITQAGKKTCKYYKACGNAENCKRCTGFEKEKKR